MRYRKLAKTDLDVSVVCFGCWGIVGGFNWGPQEETDSIAALQTAFDNGINFYDTAEGYGSGQSEQLLGRALGHVREKIIIATKVSPDHFTPLLMKDAVDRSLNNLHTDWIDLYQLHWPNHSLPLPETIDTLDRLKQDGKIRAYGVSNFGPLDLTEAQATGKSISSNQLAYNLLFRAIEYQILPMCLAQGISVITYSSLMQGVLSGKYASADDIQADRTRTRHFAGSRSYARHGEAGAETETFTTVQAIRQVANDLDQSMADMALAWLIAQNGVTSVIAGARNAKQARGIAQAADLNLNADTLVRLATVTEPLKTKLGPNPDMWQSVSRMR